MASAVSREAYFETGLEVLSDAGYGGLKLAVVCTRLGVTTGSFYHYFASWGHYTRDLIGHWQQSTRQRVTALNTITDPRERITRTCQVGLTLPYAADAAIRVWASMDADVHAAQVEVDAQRFEVIRRAAHEITGDARYARVYAEMLVYLLTGYEQSTLPGGADDLAWMFSRMLEALVNGRWAASFGQPLLPQGVPVPDDD